MLVTTLVGMLLASSHAVSWQILIFGNLGIGLTACAGAVMNHVADRHFDRLMRRTEHRPLPSGQIKPLAALFFSVLLATLGLGILFWLINPLTALLTFFSLLGYALIYTLFLKHATPQNIVIGGLAGAAPPLLGWTAVTGHLDYGGLLLMLIIFVWTPPHFWALSIYRVEEYAKANIPMLPVTHGIPLTKLHIVLYTCLLIGVSLLPFAVGMSSWIYFSGAVLLGAWFLYLAIRLWYSKDMQLAMRTFRYSIFYLLWLFVFLLADHYLIP